MSILVPYQQIHAALCELLQALLGDAERAASLATLFVEAELDGVHTHGLVRLPRLLEEIRNGDIDPQGRLEKIHAKGAHEWWDGHSGVGPLHALECTQRAVELAREYAIGCVGLRNTSHWLRPGYYGKQAAAAGCALICWTNTIPNVVAYGGKHAGIGNNPLTIALPGDPDCFLLDMALSQFSYGKLAAYAADNQSLPIAGGYDQQGRLTTDAATIVELQSAAPIGLWKGSGLIMALDLLATLLSDGDSTFEIGSRPGEQKVSQVFIAFDLLGFYGEEKYRQRAHVLFEQLKAANPGAYLPGARTAERRQKHLTDGIEVDKQLWQGIVTRTL